jgi:hypothetical protein
MFIVSDDITDPSIIHRRQPCFYGLSRTGNVTVAINDPCLLPKLSIYVLLTIGSMAGITDSQFFGHAQSSSSPSVSTAMARPSYWQDQHGYLGLEEVEGVYGDRDGEYEEAVWRMSVSPRLRSPKSSRTIFTDRRRCRDER